MWKQRRDENLSFRAQFIFPIELIDQEVLLLYASELSNLKDKPVNVHSAQRDDESQ